jgi:HAMP domain-containing protein
METLKRQLGLTLASVAAVAGVWACRATGHRDGSVTFEFSPDMTITARGLEETLGKVGKLLDDCISGRFSRPCTPDELSELNEAFGRLLDAKERLDDAEQPGPSEGVEV